jgi:hypothetical protein
MICADFLAGVHLEHGNPSTLLAALLRLFRLLPQAQQREFVHGMREVA